MVQKYMYMHLNKNSCCKRDYKLPKLIWVRVSSLTNLCVLSSMMHWWRKLKNDWQQRSQISILDPKLWSIHGSYKNQPMFLCGTESIECIKTKTMNGRKTKPVNTERHLMYAIQQCSLRDVATCRIQNKWEFCNYRQAQNMSKMPMLLHSRK